MRASFVVVVCFFVKWFSNIKYSLSLSLSLSLPPSLYLSIALSHNVFPNFLSKSIQSFTVKRETTKFVRLMDFFLGRCCLSRKCVCVCVLYRFLSLLKSKNVYKNQRQNNWLVLLSVCLFLLLLLLFLYAKWSHMCAALLTLTQQKWHWFKQTYTKKATAWNKYIQRWSIFIKYHSCYWCDGAQKQNLWIFFFGNYNWERETDKGREKKHQIKFKYVIQLTLIGHHRCRFGVYHLCQNQMKFNVAWKKTTTKSHTFYAHNAAIFCRHRCCAGTAVGYNRNACVGLCVFMRFFFIVEPLIGFFYRLPTYFYVSKVDCIIKWMNEWMNICMVWGLCIIKMPFILDVFFSSSFCAVVVVVVAGCWCVRKQTI